ncbi:hypothetical protein ACF0H5_006897 [Mactra antiquata]
MAMTWYLQVLIVSVCLKQCLSQTLNQQICIMVPQSTLQCMKDSEISPTNPMFAQISCLQDLFWSLRPDRSLSEIDAEYIRNLTSTMSGQPIDWREHLGVSGQGKMPNKPNFLYPSSGYRKRKEFRLMTSTERLRFNEAMKRAYLDGVIDRFARIHASIVYFHYNGPSFLSWNRMFLIYFEEALRRYDPNVFLPYWASPLDNAMDNPVNSVLWTPAYFGNGEGPVVSGPAAYWRHDQGFLRRYYGRRSTLVTRPQIRRIYSKCRLADISRPTADLRNDIEYLTAGPHNWLGGDMNTYEYAGYDPVFYMHRAYIDYIWEEFREKQRVRCSVEPSTDYPEVPMASSHSRHARMKVFSMFTNNDGILNHWTNNWYSYENEPECPDCCPGCNNPAPLRCKRWQNACVSRSTWADGLIPSQVSVQSPTSVFQMPRNRGALFESTFGDGRTIYTAVEDALAAARNSQPDNSTIV